MPRDQISKKQNTVAIAQAAFEVYDERHTDRIHIL